jgi:hypothetical protein
MIRKIVALGLAALLAGCGAIQVEPRKQLPPPLIDQLPVTVGVYYPDEFRTYLHQEERYQVKYSVNLGPAHVVKLQRLLQAMFARVVELDDPAHALATDPSIVMVLEPRFEDYAFLTPRDMAGDYFTVTIRYRIDVYNPRGQRVDGYVFTGYGREKSAMLSNTEPLALATERAMRDAGAKLAVEFTSQDTVRRLLARLPVEPQKSEAEEVAAALGSFGRPEPETAAKPPETGAGPESGDVAEPSTGAEGSRTDEIPPAGAQGADEAEGAENMEPSPATGTA